jgi:hypothetical protein
VSKVMLDGTLFIMAVSCTATTRILSMFGLIGIVPLDGQAALDGLALVKAKPVALTVVILRKSRLSVFMTTPSPRKARAFEDLIPSWSASLHTLAEIGAPLCALPSLRGDLGRREQAPERTK